MADRPLVVAVNADGFRALIRDLRRLKLDKPLKARLTIVGQFVADAAKANASWSSRIPRSVRVGATQKGVYVRAGVASAPHAAAYEGRPGQSSFRHPVFGHRDAWVEQATRPFLVPAVNGNLDRIEDEVAKAIDDWAREAGFK